MLENGVYVIKGNAELEHIRLSNKTKCSDCIRFSCEIFNFFENGSYTVKGGYANLFDSIIKIYYFNNPIECKIEDFVRKYEYDL